MRDNFDTQLITSYFHGDEQSLEILIKKYLKPIYGFVYKYVGNVSEAEDITQETFVKVWRNLKKFDRNKSFKTWIFSIAKNTSLDWLKKKKAVPLSSFFAQGESASGGENLFAKMLVDPAPLADKIFEKTKIAQLLQFAMDKLLPKYRLVLSLYYNDNLNFREIAEKLQEPLNTVKSRHRRALIILKKLLGS